MNWDKSIINLAAAAAAKSLQYCPTLSDPMDCSLPGSSIHGIFQARVLEWGAFAFSKLGVSGDCKDHSTKSLRSQEGVPQKKPRATTKTQAAASLDVRMGVLSSLADAVLKFVLLLIFQEGELECP